MELLVDIGNGRIKWGALEEQKLTSFGNELRPTQEFDAFATQHWLPIVPPPSRVWVSNVAGPRIYKALASWVQQQWQVETRLVESVASGWGVVNSYYEPRRLGTDRWCKLVAARRDFAQPVYVVDCGTAMTLDVVNSTGGHLGGLILPGLGLMRRSLQDKTQAVRVQSRPPRRQEQFLLARETSGAVIGGTLYAVVAVVDRVAQDVESELGVPLKRLITGGDASLVLPLLREGFEMRPHLVLDGLSIIATQAQ